MTTWRTLLVLLVLATAFGCGRDPERGYTTIPRERFIETNVALRQIDRTAPEADSLRAEVLAQHGVTEDDLRVFVTARSGRPAELAAVWEEIQRRLAEQGADVEPIEMEAAQLEDGGVPVDARAREMSWDEMAGTGTPATWTGGSAPDDPRP